MTGYRKVVDKNDTETQPSVPRFCQIRDCNRMAVVVISKGRSGQQIGRCARHYTEDVDNAKRGAVSALISAQLEVEQEEMAEVGLERYREEARIRRAHFLGRMSK